VIEEQAKRILDKVSAPLNLADVSAKYPVKYEESMNTVLVQEVSLSVCQCVECVCLSVCCLLCCVHISV